MLKIFELREGKGITQKQLAEYIGVRNYTIGNWEQGRTEPSIGELVALANFFECSVDYLIGREDDFGNVVLVKNLSDEQTRLIGSYCKLSENKQKLIMELIGDLAQVDSKK